MNGCCAQRAGLLDIYGNTMQVRRPHTLHLYPPLYLHCLLSEPSHLLLMCFISILAVLPSSSLPLLPKSSMPSAIRVIFLKLSGCITFLLKNSEEWGSNPLPDTDIPSQSGANLLASHFMTNWIILFSHMCYFMSSYLGSCFFFVLTDLPFKIQLSFTFPSITF